MRALLIATVLVATACSGGDQDGAASDDTTVASSVSPASSVPSAADTVTPSTSAAPETTQDTTATTDPATITVEMAGPAQTVDELLELGRPIVLAHAGGEDQFPHSTAYAFAQSAAAGVDMLDLDVQLTGDGVLVVHHDSDIDRTTNGTGDVAAMTYAELSAYDNAYWFTAECVCRDQPDEAYVYRGIRTGDVPPPAGATPDDFAVPRFRDIVERWPDIPLNIEIKGTGEPAIAAAEVLAAELTELDRLDASVVTSFDDTVVEAFAELAPTVELTPGLGLSTAWVLDSTPLPDGMRILQLPPEYQGLEVLTPEVIERSHAAGYVIWVWPNDRAYENADGYRRLLEMGMDGLNINFPALGIDAVRQFMAGNTVTPGSLEEMDALIPVIEVSREAQRAIPFLGTADAEGNLPAATEGFVPAADDRLFCWAVEVVNSRPYPVDEYEEVVVGGRYFAAIERFAPADVADDLDVLIAFTDRITEQGSFGEPDEVEGGRVADAIATTNAVVDTRCLGRS
jgi:glycerophosphoryl diester phosphodiesterase